MPNEFDVVVVGTGAAGLSAALAADANGAKVLVIEKADVVGGHHGDVGWLYLGSAKPKGRAARDRRFPRSGHGLHPRGLAGRLA